MNKCNLTIIKTVVIFSVYLYAGFSKTLISILSYLGLKFFISITYKSVEQVNYESTVAGGAVTYLFQFHDRYFPIIRIIWRYTHSIALFFLKLFVRSFSSRPTLLVYVLDILGCIKITVLLLSLFCSICTAIIKFDLQKFLLKYSNTNEFKQIYEIVDSISIIHI